MSAIIFGARIGLVSGVEINVVHKGAKKKFSFFEETRDLFKSSRNLWRAIQLQEPFKTLRLKLVVPASEMREQHFVGFETTVCGASLMSNYFRKKSGQKHDKRRNEEVIPSKPKLTLALTPRCLTISDSNSEKILFSSFSLSFPGTTQAKPKARHSPQKPSDSHDNRHRSTRG